MKMSEAAGLSRETLEEFQKNFSADPKNLLAQNVCSTNHLTEICRSRRVVQNTQHCFSNKLEKEGKPMTDQKASGRCWIFACLNLMRVPFMKKYDLEEFEFSQHYLFFWDKLERANYLLNSFCECARKGETQEGRLIHHLLFNPSEDGGQWDMLTNIVEKYGVVPKTCFPDSWNSEDSIRLGRLLNNKFREFCKTLLTLVKDGASEAAIEEQKKGMMEEFYRLLCITLGTPLTTITYQFYNSKSEYQAIGPISPQDFYKTLIKPDLFDMEDMVCIVNDPRPQNAYNKLYTVEYLGNMTGGKPVLYINKPIEVLKELAIKSLVDSKEPVWFGCDVGKHFSTKDCSLDLTVLDYEVTFGLDMMKLSKAERLMYCESLMTHAMVLTGVNLKLHQGDKQAADKWRVQNSWGDQTLTKGFLTMTDDWFSEFVFEVVVSKKLLDKETLAILDQEPVLLPAWDPMGALAKS